MAFSLQIITDSGNLIFSHTHLLPPMETNALSLLQGFYMSGKESGGFQPKSLQTASGNIVFEDFSFGNFTYIFILTTNQTLGNKGTNYTNLLKIINFIQIALINSTGPEIWICEDVTQIESLKKELKVY